MYDNLFSDLTEDIDPGRGTAWDFFGNVAWGTASGFTWGATELGRTSKDWNEMTSAGKAGWILGEGLGMMAPFVGPFALLGKGSKAVAKGLGANKFLGKAADNVTKNISKGLKDPGEAQKILEKARKIAEQTPGRTIDEVLESTYGAGIKKQLAKVAKDDETVC